MNKKMKEFVKREFPQKADNIIKNSLSEKILREKGIDLLPDEIFVRFWKPWDEYYGSNYGRLISTKCGKFVLRNVKPAPDGHICYVLTNPSQEVDGKVITSRGMGTSIDFALAIAEIFCGREAAENMADKIVYRAKGQEK